MKLRSIALACLAALTLSTSSAFAWDHDGNPPGPRGGPGTNWENPPGWRGGPGASPDRHWRRVFWNNSIYAWHPIRRCWLFDRDGNPPGPRGGPGTNWENPPGWRGGPGASPDRNLCR